MEENKIIWQKIFEAFIPGPAKGQPRPRATAMMGRRGRFVGHVYKSRAQEIAEAICRVAMDIEGEYSLGVKGPFPTESPVELRVSAYIRPPKTMTKQRRAEIAAGIAFPIKKPDLKNIIALVEDVMTGRIFRDDAQVVCISATKDYTKEGSELRDREGIRVVVNEATVDKAL